VGVVTGNMRDLLLRRSFICLSVVKHVDANERKPCSASLTREVIRVLIFKKVFETPSFKKKKKKRKKKFTGLSSSENFRNVCKIFNTVSTKMFPCLLK